MRSRHADRIGGAGDGGVEPGQPGDAVAQDRQHRIERQGEQRGQEAERGDAPADQPRQDEQQRIEERKQGERRDGLDEAGEGEGDAAELRPAGGEQGERQADDHAERERGDGEQDVLGEQRGHAGQRIEERAHRLSAASRSA